MMGKKTRPPIKRTTSMKEFSMDPNNPFKTNMAIAPAEAKPTRRHSADFLLEGEATCFLRACSLCKGPLVPARDIFMYRGDTAFCSLECRQHQIDQDEIKKKHSCASKKEVVKSSNGSKVPSPAKKL